MDAQIAGGEFNLEGNLALLNLYQFFPAHVDLTVVRKVLVHALMQLPMGDFHLCLHMVPQAVQADPSVASLMALVDLLESFELESFWKELAASRAVVDVVPGFDAALRRYIAHGVQLSYFNVQRSLLAKNLDLQGAALDDYIAGQGWEAKGDLVQVRKRQHESLHLDGAAEVKRGGVTLQQLSPAIKAGLTF